MMIGNVDPLLRSVLSTSMPSMPGMRWSSTMTSGSCSATAASASLPSAASATSNPSPDRAWPRTHLMFFSSSTMSTRLLMRIPFTRPSLREA